MATRNTTATPTSPAELQSNTSEHLILFAERGMLVTFKDEGEILVDHAKVLSNCADGVLAAVEVLLRHSVEMMDDEIRGAIGGARALLQLSDAAHAAAAGAKA